jgi:hypothetical protein
MKMKTGRTGKLAKINAKVRTHTSTTVFNAIKRAELESRAQMDELEKVLSHDFGGDSEFACVAKTLFAVDFLFKSNWLMNGTSGVNGEVIDGLARIVRQCARQAGLMHAENLAFVDLALQLDDKIKSAS